MDPIGKAPPHEKILDPNTVNHMATGFQGKPLLEPYDFKGQAEGEASFKLAIIAQRNYQRKKLGGQKIVGPSTTGN